MKYFIGYKKSILTSIGFLFFMGFLKAQQPNNARLLFEQQDVAAAKQSIDSFVLTNAGSAAGWLLKARIYNAISKDQNLKDLVADGRMDAFIALQKAMQLNKPYTQQELAALQYSLPFDIYNGYTDDGLTWYNAGAESNDKNSFSTALDKFKKAGMVSRLIFTNGWGLTAFDTANTYYAARAAIMAGKEEDAFLLAKKIADAGITQSLTTKTMERIYEWLAYYYKKQKDGNNLLKYARMSTFYFPADVYFNLILVDWYRQQQDYSNMFTQYQQLFTKQPGNSKYQLAYLNDVFNYLFNNKVPITNRADYENILDNGLTAFVKSNSTSVAARLLLAKLYFNQGQEPAMRTAAERINLLKRSNTNLKEILARFCNTTSENCEEARLLLVRNIKVIKALQGR